jgi:hypothetical protein
VTLPKTGLVTPRTFSPLGVKKNSKNHVVLNQNGEYIAGYLIHMNKNKTK